MPDCIKLRIKYNYLPSIRPKGRSKRSRESLRPKAIHRIELSYPLSRVVTTPRDRMAAASADEFVSPPLGIKFHE